MSTTKKTGTSSNLERLKQAFASSKETGGGSYNWWRPGWGDNIVRVLPPIDPDGLFYHETARHRVNEEWFYCLKFDIDPETGRGKKCPICEARTRLFRSGDEDLIKVAKDIKAKKQYLMNIVDRKADDPETVHVYATGIKLWNKMVTTMIDDDIDITDIEEGFDFLIKKEEGPKTDIGQFPNYDNSKAKRKSSPLDEDPKVVKKILESRSDLESIPRFDEEEYLQSAVDSFIKNLSETTQDETFYNEEEKEKPAPSSKAKSNVEEFRSKLAAQLRSDDD